MIQYQFLRAHGAVGPMMENQDHSLLVAAKYIIIADGPSRTAHAVHEVEVRE